MEINININGKLTIEEDDIERFKIMDAGELLRAMALNGSEVKVKVTEIYQKKEG